VYLPPTNLKLLTLPTDISPNIAYIFGIIISHEKCSASTWPLTNTLHQIQTSFISIVSAPHSLLMHGIHTCISMNFPFPIQSQTNTKYCASLPLLVRIHFFTTTSVPVGRWLSHNYFSIALLPPPVRRPTPKITNMDPTIPAPIMSDFLIHSPVASLLALRYASSSSA